jgi:hypothetical protein
MNKNPVNIHEAMRSVQRMLDSQYGRALKEFDVERERKVRLEAIDLLERYLLAGAVSEAV